MIHLLLVPYLTTPAFLRVIHHKFFSGYYHQTYIQKCANLGLWWIRDIPAFGSSGKNIKKIYNKAISSLEPTFKLQKSNRVGSHRGELNSRTTAKENRADFQGLSGGNQLVPMVPVPWGWQYPKRHAVLKTGMNFLLVSWVFAQMKVFKMVCCLLLTLSDCDSAPWLPSPYFILSLSSPVWYDLNEYRELLLITNENNVNK